MRFKIFFFTLLIISFFSFQNYSQQNSYLKKDPVIEKKVDLLLSKMTLEEKIGQLVRKTEINSETGKMIREGKFGIMGNPGRQIRDSLQKIAVEQSRLHIPLAFAADVIHGYHTIFPVPLAQSCSWDPELAEKAARIAALEASSDGLNWTFAPMVDIARDPRWGRIVEGAGEDPYLGSIMAAAYVKGYQGKSLSDEGSISATAKHYVAYGAAQAGRDYNTVDISARTLREIYLPPFHAAVNAGTGSIMSAFNDLNGVPASGNYFTLTKILRDEWKFKGVVISDYNSIGELVNHGVAKNKSDAARVGITAGVDVDLAGDTITGDIYAPYLENLVENRIVPEKLIDRSVRRVLRLKYELGLFDHPYVDTAFFRKDLPSQEDRNKIAQQLADESIVLLKNEKNVLPLKKDIHSIALIGPLANDQDDLIGPWAPDGISKNVVTVLEGIKNKISPKTKINYVKGCDFLDSSSAEFDEAVNAAKESDVAVLVVGESRDMSGEASSRAFIDVPGIQEELIKEIYKTGKPVVVVLMNGRPLTINWESENVPAILETWFLGNQTGNAIADVLFGDYNPSGKLTATFPRAVGQIPIFYNHMNTGRPPSPTDHYTSKYLDCPVTPLYPFGYGLSYANFSYSDLTIDKKNISENDSSIASIKVTNNSSIGGTEIVQLYTHDHFADVTPPVKELKGFKRIYLQPGESKIVKFVIKPEMLAQYNIDMKKVIEPGIYDVMIGRNSDDYLKTSFELKK